MEVRSIESATDPVSLTYPLECLLVAARLLLFSTRSLECLLYIAVVGNVNVF